HDGLTLASLENVDLGTVVGLDRPLGDRGDEIGVLPASDARPLPPDEPALDQRGGPGSSADAERDPAALHRASAPDSQRGRSSTRSPASRPSDRPSPAARPWAWAPNAAASRGSRP